MYLECWLHAFGALIWYWCRNYSSVVPMLYIGCGIVLHTTHRLGHDSTVWQPWYVAHTFGHHQQAYPSNRFVNTTKYVQNQHDAWNLNVIAYIVMCSLFGCCVHLVHPWTSSDFMIDVFAVFLLLQFENVIHNAIHFPTPWIAYRAKCKPLDDLISCASSRHDAHHKYKYVNYAVVSWWFDWMLGTYQ